MLQHGAMYECISGCVKFHTINTLSTNVGRLIMLVKFVDASAADLIMSVCIATIVGSCLILLALAKHLKFFWSTILIFGGRKRCHKVSDIGTMVVVLLPLVFVH